MTTNYTLGSNATMAERVRFGERVPAEDIADVLERYAVLVDALDDLGLTSDNPETLTNELEALQRASGELGELLDVTNCDTSLRLENRFADLQRFTEVCEEYDITDPSALRDTLDNLNT